MKNATIEKLVGMGATQSGNRLYLNSAGTEIIGLEFNGCKATLNGAQISASRAGRLVYEASTVYIDTTNGEVWGYGSSSMLKAIRAWVAAEEPEEPLKKFIVIDQPRSGFSGDEWTTVYDTASEATEAADRAWCHLTAREQRVRHIFSAVVYEEMLDDDAVDEDGVIDWECWANAGTYDGAFDSAKVVEEDEDEEDDDDEE